MTLQEELNNIKEILQAVIDYVGNPQIANQVAVTKEKQRQQAIQTSAFEEK